MKIRIETAENGFVLFYTFPKEDGSEETIMHIFEGEDRDAFVALATHLWENYLGEPYDKYGKDNLSIKFNKKGHKYEDSAPTGAKL